MSSHIARLGFTSQTPAVLPAAVPTVSPALSPAVAPAFIPTVVPPAAPAGSALFIATSRNRKLSPVSYVPTTGRPRPVARAPFVCATYASIAATCPDGCAFKSNGCYVRHGATKRLSARLDIAAREFDADDVIELEATLIEKAYARGVPQDGAVGGRDLRLHVGGDISNERQAARLGTAATGWRARGGGAVWTYTHSWRDVRRTAWGSDVSVLASVERPEDITAANDMGYAAALVVPRFETTKVTSIDAEGARGIPCPAQVTDRTCVECRLCLDADGLRSMKLSILFEAHGPAASTARARLVQLRRKEAPFTTG